MKLAGAVVLLLFPLAGMAAKIPYPSERKVISFEYVIKPQLGQSATAEVGNALYKETIKLKSATHYGKLTQDVESDLGEGRKLLLLAKSGGPMMLHAVTKKPMICFPARNTTFASRLNGRTLLGCVIDREEKGVFDAASYNDSDVYVPISPPATYESHVVDAEIEVKDKFHVEVLYQGVSKGEIKISYREFMNDMARPAFNQDLSYELNSKGPTAIGFKGMRLRVLKADSQSIEYIVDQPIASDLRSRVEAANAADDKTQPWR